MFRITGIAITATLVAGTGLVVLGTTGSGATTHPNTTVVNNTTSVKAESVRVLPANIPDDRAALIEARKANIARHAAAALAARAAAEAAGAPASDAAATPAAPGATVGPAANTSGKAASAPAAAAPAKGSPAAPAPAPAAPAPAPAPAPAWAPDWSGYVEPTGTPVAYTCVNAGPTEDEIVGGTSIRWKITVTWRFSGGNWRYWEDKVLRGPSQGVNVTTTDWLTYSTVPPAGLPLGDATAGVQAAPMNYTAGVNVTRNDAREIYSTASLTLPGGICG